MSEWQTLQKSVLGFCLLLNSFNLFTSVFGFGSIFEQLVGQDGVWGASHFECVGVVFLVNADQREAGDHEEHADADHVAQVHYFVFHYVQTAQLIDIINIFIN